MSVLTLILIIIGCLIFQAFFAMTEMASVSFNKLRLNYYVSKQKTWAIWLNNLLQHPARLFGVTLVAVNTTLELGSECTRRIYTHYGLSPDWASITHFVVVLIFAALAPLFAARRHAEHVAKLGVPVVYFFSIIFRPVIWFFAILCKLVNLMFGAQSENTSYLTREELQKALETRRKHRFSRHIGVVKGDFDNTLTQIFSLKNTLAKQLMQPLKKVGLLSAQATVLDVKNELRKYHLPFVLVYQSNNTNVTGVVYPHSLLHFDDQKAIKGSIKAPWFIAQNSPVFQILKQFRSNNQVMAVVLDDTGVATGVLTLDDILDELFENNESWSAFEELTPKDVIERTFLGSTPLSEINKELNTKIGGDPDETLSELIETALGRKPVEGDVITVGKLEFIVKEASLLGVKTVLIHSLY